ncbi:MAG: FkbM family methyltransferase [Pseudochelatococcus sp.]|jgi:FkbM family methyltransferase|uniref:FkbM family methyltransferase n=1 Tax=Pseudochelatococcus sp. TaxID=2020869 RepID=UPI003D92C1A8
MLERLLETTSKIDEFLETSKDNPSVVLYGAGFAMPAILRKLESYGFLILAVCDSDTRKHGRKFRDTYPVMSFEAARRDFPHARFVISSPDYFAEIYSFLRESLDERNLCDVDLECAHYFEKGEFNEFFTSELPRLRKIHESLEDEESKETYFKIIKAHMSGRREDFEDAFTGNDDWYLFQSLLKPTAETVYVDCGAYDGDTLKLFLKAADEGYHKIFAFEPDPAMQRSLNAVSDSENGKIRIIPKGVSNSDGTLSFRTNGVYSNIVGADAADEEDLISIPVTKLDSLLLNEDVSIVKMDIEGGEYEALQGAAQLIQKFRPKLAICLYHKVEDFVRIAELLLNLVPDYKLRLKHQSKSCTDTILFASLD